jgi:hypothetical protein
MQIFVRALCVLFSLSIALPIAAAAEDRTQTYSGQIPSSTQTNQQTRDDRTALGVFARDVLGAAATAGTYANLSVVPNGGMYVAVQPTGAGNGSVYQIKPEDPLPLPQNQAVQLSTDTNPIVLIGLQNGPTGGVGPMTAPTSGNSVIYLVEAQISTIDGANRFRIRRAVRIPRACRSRVPIRCRIKSSRERRLLRRRLPPQRPDGSRSEPSRFRRERLSSRRA